MLGETDPADGTVRVWSGFVRATHWLVAGIVLFNLFNETGIVHRYAGYVAAGLVVLRLMHGWRLPAHDLSHIGLPRWSALMAHGRELRQRQVHRVLGHNPAGELMALLLWALVLLLALTGWMSRLDAFWGEEWVTDLHAWLARAMQVAILGHWAGVVLMSVLQRENLAKAMVTGRKKPL